MIVFHTDLDNTMIYSYKHELGTDKKCVEVYQGREISFVTFKTYELLKRVQDKVLFVPTTTRTVDQYNRIDLGIGIPKYALTCNGGVLLVDGVEDPYWYQESLELVEVCQGELKKAELLLEHDHNRAFEVRNIRELFIFTKCNFPEESIEKLRNQLDLALVDVFHNGIKVYVVPKKLSKGNAVRRFREKVNTTKVIVAGDSEFDLSMFTEAEIGLAPKELAQKYELPDNVTSFARDVVFSECVLEYIMNME